MKRPVTLTGAALQQRVLRRATDRMRLDSRMERGAATLLRFAEAKTHPLWQRLTLRMVAAGHLGLDGIGSQTKCIGCGMRWQYSRPPSAVLGVEHHPTEHREVRGVCLTCSRRPTLYSIVLKCIERDFRLRLENCSAITEEYYHG